GRRDRPLPLRSDRPRGSRRHPVVHVEARHRALQPRRRSAQGGSADGGSVDSRGADRVHVRVGARRGPALLAVRLRARSGPPAGAIRRPRERAELPLERPERAFARRRARRRAMIERGTTDMDRNTTTPATTLAAVLALAGALFA